MKVELFDGPWETTPEPGNGIFHGTVTDKLGMPHGFLFEAPRNADVKTLEKMAAAVWSELEAKRRPAKSG